MQRRPNLEHGTPHPLRAGTCGLEAGPLKPNLSPGQVTILIRLRHLLLSDGRGTTSGEGENSRQKVEHPTSNREHLTPDPSCIMPCSKHAEVTVPSLADWERYGGKFITQRATKVVAGGFPAAAGCHRAIELTPVIFPDWRDKGRDCFRASSGTSGAGSG